MVSTKNNEMDEQHCLVLSGPLFVTSLINVHLTNVGNCDSAEVTYVTRTLEFCIKAIEVEYKLS